MAVDRINPGAMLAREIKKSKLSFKTLGERLERDPETVQLMLTRDTISAERLLACCNALNYNFFLEIGYKIPYPGPADTRGNPLNTTVTNLEKEVKAKDLKIEELQKVISEADIQKRLLETEINTIKFMMKEIFAAKQV